MAIYVYQVVSSWPSYFHWFIVFLLIFADMILLCTFVVRIRMRLNDWTTHYYRQRGPCDFLRGEQQQHTTYPQPVSQTAHGSPWQCHHGHRRWQRDRQLWREGPCSGRLLCDLQHAARGRHHRHHQGYAAQTAEDGRRHRLWRERQAHQRPHA